jgi:NADPH-dependent 2,4-dienoyl-CoA reductase/sulfur reductase-like enzyme
MSAARLVVALVLCCASSAAATTAVSPPVSDDAGSDAFKSLQLDLIARIAAAADGDALEEALRGGLDAPALAFSAVPSQAIAVIGGGLSGLVSTLRLLELGRSVVLIDKARFFGGNSAKASSGINGCITERQEQLNITEDSVEVFYRAFGNERTGGVWERETL